MRNWLISLQNHETGLFDEQKLHTGVGPEPGDVLFIVQLGSGDAERVIYCAGAINSANEDYVVLSRSDAIMQAAPYRLEALWMSFAGKDQRRIRSVIRGRTRSAVQIGASAAQVIVDGIEFPLPSAMRALRLHMSVLVDDLLALADLRNADLYWTKAFKDLVELLQTEVMAPAYWSSHCEKAWRGGDISSGKLAPMPPMAFSKEGVDFIEKIDFKLAQEVVEAWDVVLGESGEPRSRQLQLIERQTINAADSQDLMGVSHPAYPGGLFVDL